MDRIMKYGLLVVKNKKILLQDEKGHTKLLMPGGKPLKGEDPVKCLVREIKEELNAEIDVKSLQYLGKFEDIAAKREAILTMELYKGDLTTKPKPSNEVKKLVWFGKTSNQDRLSPIIRNKVMPYVNAMRLLD